MPTEIRKIKLFQKLLKIKIMANEIKILTNGILYETRRFTIWIDGSDLTFEYNSNGESFTLYCDIAINTITDRIDNVVVLDYDGCFDFNRKHVIQALKLYNPYIEIDFSEL